MLPPNKKALSRDRALRIFPKIRSGRGRLDNRKNTDCTAARRTLDRKVNRTIDQRKKRVITPYADAIAWMKCRATLPDDDITRTYDLTAITLDTQSLGF
jgi:hypothetical protein